MKKAIAIIAVFALVLLAGCGKKAEPIELPSNDAVASIEVTTKDGTKTTLTDNDEINAIIAVLSEAEATRSESVNDQPTNVESYLTISINADGKDTLIYCYERDGKSYAEQPYRGIYELKKDFKDSFERKKLTMN